MLGGIASAMGPALGRLFGGDEGTPESKQGGKPSGGNGGLPSGNASAVLGFASQQLGDRYILGADGPDAWDCSSLTEAAYRSIGIDIGPNTWAQIEKGTEVPMDKLQPGDLVFYNDLSHVGMYQGNGRVIEAANPSRGVVEGPMYSKFQRARRIMNGSVEATGTQGGDQNDPTKSWGGKGGYSVAAGYGSVEEVDALAAALASGGVGGMQAGGRTPSSQMNEESKESGSTIPAGPGNPTGNKALGKQMAAAYGWGSGPQWDALHELWMRESGWSSTADNPTSDAYGIPQAMSNLYPETATREWRESAAKQIEWGLKYIAGRYKKNGPIEAVQFHDRMNWYDRGAWSIPGDQVAKLHAGEMVLTKQQATTMRQAMLEQGLGTGSGRGGGSITIDMGNVNISMPAATAEGAQSAAKQFVDYVAADDRVKTLMGGW